MDSPWSPAAASTSGSAQAEAGPSTLASSSAAARPRPRSGSATGPHQPRRTRPIDGESSRESSYGPPRRRASPSPPLHHASGSRPRSRPSSRPRRPSPSLSSSNTYVDFPPARPRSLSPTLERTPRPLGGPAASRDPLLLQMLHGRTDQGWGDRKARVPRSEPENSSSGLALAASTAVAAAAEDHDEGDRYRNRTGGDSAARDRRRDWVGTPTERDRFRNNGERDRDRDCSPRDNYRLRERVSVSRWDRDRDRDRDRGRRSRSGSRSASRSGAPSLSGAGEGAGSESAVAASAAFAAAGTGTRVHLPDLGRAAAQGGFQIPYRVRRGKRAREEDGAADGPTDSEREDFRRERGKSRDGGKSRGGREADSRRIGVVGGGGRGGGAGGGRRAVSESQSRFGYRAASDDFDSPRFAPPSVPPAPTTTTDPYTRYSGVSSLLSRLDPPPAPLATTTMTPRPPALVSTSTLPNGVPIPTAALPRRAPAKSVPVKSEEEEEEPEEGELEEGELDEATERGAPGDERDLEPVRARPPPVAEANGAERALEERDGTPPLPVVASLSPLLPPVKKEEGAHGAAAEEEPGTPPPPPQPVTSDRHSPSSIRRSVSYTPTPPPVQRPQPQPTPPLTVPARSETPALPAPISVPSIEEGKTLDAEAASIRPPEELSIAPEADEPMPDLVEMTPRSASTPPPPIPLPPTQAPLSADSERSSAVTSRGVDPEGIEPAPAPAMSSPPPASDVESRLETAPAPTMGSPPPASDTESRLETAPLAKLPNAPEPANEPTPTVSNATTELSSCPPADSGPSQSTVERAASPPAVPLPPHSTARPTPSPMARQRPLPPPPPPPFIPPAPSPPSSAASANEHIAVPVGHVAKDEEELARAAVPREQLPSTEQAATLSTSAAPNPTPGSPSPGHVTSAGLHEREAAPVAEETPAELGSGARPPQPGVDAPQAPQEKAEQQDSRRQGAQSGAAPEPLSRADDVTPAAVEVVSGRSVSPDQVATNFDVSTTGNLSPDVEMTDGARDPAPVKQEVEDTDMSDADIAVKAPLPGAEGTGDLAQVALPGPAPPSPHPTDELHRHSPTTPQEQHEAEIEHASGRSPSPIRPDDKGNEQMDEDSEDPVRAREQERFKLTGGITVPEASVAERDAFFAVTWDSLDEPHQRLSSTLFELFTTRDQRRRDKAIALRREYKALHQDWKAHCARLDKIRDRVHRREQQAPSSNTAPQTPSIDSAGMPFYPEPVTPGPSIGGGGGGGGGLFGGGIISSGRANRRSAGVAGAAFGGYGDAVRSEAEFLEILASLETADLRDPDVRAARTAAVVPDMVIDAAERREVLEIAFDDDERYRVDDPVDTYGIHQPLEVWTEDEVETFCKRYAARPKQFGKIAADLPNKSTAQCVLFYYRMKNTIDFRSLSDRRGRDGRRKKGKKRPESGKGSSLLSNLNKKPRMPPPPAIDEREDEDERESAPTSPRFRRREPASASSGYHHLGPALPRARPRPSTSATVSAPEDNSDDLSTRPNTASTPQPSSTLAPVPAAPNGPLPPSEGMLEAAEALGALGALAAAAEVSSSGYPAVAGGNGDDAMQVDDPATPRVRVRKPRSAAAGVAAATANEMDAMLGDETPHAAGDPSLPGAKPKRRSNTSSYWTVAERNEIVRLLGIYGTDWKKVAEGVGNKTWVQCRNWYQSNAKKQGLADIVNESDGVAGDRSAAVEHFGNGTLYQNRVALASTGPSLPRAGFFDAPDRHQLPPLPSLDASSRPGSAGNAGMHLRNMLNDEPEEEGVSTPAREDWFGTDGGDGASVTTEDDPDAAVAQSSTAVNAAKAQSRALDGLRTSSGSQANETARSQPNGLSSLFRATTRLPSFPSSFTSERRVEGHSRVSSFTGQPWPHSPASPFPSFVASPGPSASPVTPAQPVSDYYRRTTYEPTRTVPGTPDYFSVKQPYERYARSMDPPGSTPLLTPYGQQQQQQPPPQAHQQRLASSFPPPPSAHLPQPSPHWSHDPIRR